MVFKTNFHEVVVQDYLNLDYRNTWGGEILIWVNDFSLCSQTIRVVPVSTFVASVVNHFCLFVLSALIRVISGYIQYVLPATSNCQLLTGTNRPAIGRSEGVEGYEKSKYL